MNIRLASFILVSALTLTFAISGYAQSTEDRGRIDAGSAVTNVDNNGDADGDGNLDFMELELTDVNNQGARRLNSPVGVGVGLNLLSQINAFYKVTESAEQTLGTARMLELVAAGTGLSVPELQAQYQTATVPLGNFILATIIARSANIPVATVLAQFSEGTNLNSILRQYGMTMREFKAEMESYYETFIAVTDSALGQGINPQQSGRRFLRALEKANRKMERFSSRMGSEAFNNILYQQLATLTGLTIDQINGLRAGLASDVTASQFAFAVMAAHSLSAARGATITASDLSGLLTASDLSNALAAQNIPLELFSARVKLLSRGINAAISSEDDDDLTRM